MSGDIIMYGRGAGSLVTSTGIALLPNTGDSSKLFIVAASLVVAGIVVLIFSTVASRKARLSI